jgi:putative lipoic acid-binding regulatory protein
MEYLRTVTGMQNSKPEITYPCRWGYKVIGIEESSLRLAIETCLAECFADESPCRPYELGFSRVSDKGKYVSLSLSLQVQDEVERNALFRALADRPEIRMVI